MIQQIEEISAEFNAFRLSHRKALTNRKIDVALSGPTQDIASDVTDVRSGVTGQSGGVICTRNPLPWLYYGRGKSVGVERITWRDVPGCNSAIRSYRPISTGPDNPVQEAPSTVNNIPGQTGNGGH